METSNQLEPGTDKKYVASVPMHHCVLATVITQSQLHVQIKHSLANLLGCGENNEPWYNVYACTLGPALLCIILLILFFSSAPKITYYDKYSILCT